MQSNTGTQSPTTSTEVPPVPAGAGSLWVRNNETKMTLEGYVKGEENKELAATLKNNVLCFSQPQ